jgi:hypothetical protein
MQCKSFLTRMIWLPIDLIKMVFLAIRISLWNLLIIVKSTVLRTPPSRAFCHPERIDTGAGIRLNVCPFARRFGSPGLFALLCGYCRRSQRPGSECLYMCRRRGSGPASSVTQICFGILPILVIVAAFVWHLDPGAELVEDVSSLLDPSSSDKGHQRPAAARKKRPAPASYEPAGIGTTEGSQAAKPKIPPMPAANREEKTKVPPPPLGYSPQDRRVDTVTPPPPTISDVARQGPTTAELLAQANEASKLGKHGTVQRLTSQVLGKKPDNLQALLLLAKSQLALGRDSLAKATANRTLSLYPNAAEAHAVLGKIHLSEGRTEDARVEYEHALRLDPTCALARAGLARILILSTPRN